MRQDGQGLLSWKCGCREVNRVAELLPLSGIGFSFAARFKFAPPNHWANLIRSLVALRDRSTIGHEVDVPNRCSSTIGHEVDVPDGLFANSMIIIDFHNFYCVTYAFHIL